MERKRLTATGVDELGKRLRNSALLPGDELLFVHFYGRYLVFGQQILSDLRSMPTPKWHGGPTLPITARSIKSTASIGDKLRRTTIRLAQIQDIVGARIIVNQSLAQDEIVAMLPNHFDISDIKDYRVNAKAGYRAVHVVLKSDDLRYELQVRTAVEDLWASIVELLIPHVGIGIKYGEGPEDLRQALLDFSDWVARTNVGLRAHYDRLGDPKAPARGWISAEDAKEMTNSLVGFMSTILGHMGLTLDVLRGGLQP